MLCKLVVFIYLGQALYMLRFMHFLVESVRLPNVEERHARILGNPSFYIRPYAISI